VWDVIVDFVVVLNINARVCSHDRRGDHHTNKSQGNQKVVHDLSPVRRPESLQDV